MQERMPEPAINLLLDFRRNFEVERSKAHAVGRGVVWLHSRVVHRRLRGFGRVGLRDLVDRHAQILRARIQAQ